MVNSADSHAMVCYLDIQGALKKIGDPCVLRDLLVMLADLLAQNVPAIARALGAGDLADAGSRLHALKGCMPIFCNPEICHRVAAAELAANQGLSAQSAQAFAPLRLALERLESEIDDYLAQPPLE